MENINHSLSAKPGLVVMTCGVASSGKTTFAQKLETQGFSRLSIDEEIWATFGRFGINYPEADYSKYQDLARDIVEGKLLDNLKNNQATVLDLSFWSKDERERVAKPVAHHGGEHQIVYLKVPGDVLKARIKDRSKRFDANAVFTITDEIFDLYFNGFQEPKGEDEIVIEVY